MLKEESFLKNCFDCKIPSNLIALCKLGHHLHFWKWNKDQFIRYKSIFQSFTKCSRLSHCDSTNQSTFTYKIDLAQYQCPDFKRFWITSNSTPSTCWKTGHTCKQQAKEWARRSAGTNQAERIKQIRDQCRQTSEPLFSEKEIEEEMEEKEDQMVFGTLALLTHLSMVAFQVSRAAAPKGTKSCRTQGESVRP